MSAPHPSLVRVIAGQPVESDLTISSAILASAEEHGVVALLHEGLQRPGISAPRAVARQLTMHRLQTEAHIARADAALELFLDRAWELGIEVCLFKGSATSRHWFSDRSLRPMTDIDVFVDPRARNATPRLFDAFDPEVAAAANALISMGLPFDYAIRVAGVSIDIHSDPLKLPVPQRHTTILWDRSRSVDVGIDMATRATDLETSIVVALVHGLRDNFPDLLHLVELAMLCDSEPAPDWQFIEEYASREGILEIVRYATAVAFDLLGRHSPLPPATRIDARVSTRLLWPRRKLLMGDQGVVASLRRQALVGLMMRGRRLEVARALAHRLAPPRALVDLDRESRDLPYPIGVYRWRRRQRARLVELTHPSRGDDA